MIRKNKICYYLFILIAIFILTVNVEANSTDKVNGLIYFYSPTCSSCTAVSPILDKLETTVIKYDISTNKGLSYFNTYCEKLDVPTSRRYTPMVFINEEVFIGEAEITNNVESIVIEYKVLHTPMYELDDIKNIDISIMGIFFGGFVNGLNPCSFAMFLFLVSLCVNKPEKIKEIMFSFIIAKLLTFLALGTLLFNILNLVNVNLFSDVINVVLSILIVTLIILNLADLINVKSEKYGKIKLQLHPRIRKINHNILKIVTRFFDSNMLWMVVFLLGVLVSLTEFLCTGQIYLVSIITLIQFDNELSIINFLYLLTYNIAMVLPLALISFVISNKNIFKCADFIREKTWLIKLINIIFLLFVLLKIWVV